MGFVYGCETVKNIIIGFNFGIVFGSAVFLPIVALAICKESKALRYCNYLIQAIIFVISIIGIIALAFLIEIYDLPE